jgi:hypothetical protein
MPSMASYSSSRETRSPRAKPTKLRADLIGHCRTHFKRVRVFGTERELADAMVEFFPGEKSTRLHAAIHADANSV